ncbi:MAG: translation elongation factor Ts [bacterium]|nr:translation elongation factor Ts [bacterium]
MEIKACDVNELRKKTGAGMMLCKKALEEANGVMEKAVEILRKKGIDTAMQKSGRATKEGTIVSYIHPGAKLGVLLEISCETDFVAKTNDFQSLAKDIAMHIAAANPLYVRREEIPPEVLEKEKEIFAFQLKEQKKPDNIIEKILPGKIDKYCAEICLMEQPFVKTPEVSINNILTERIAKLGENIIIRRFIRFKLGE